MKSEKINFTKIKLLSIVLAVAVLFGSAYVAVLELSNYAYAAKSNAEEDAQQTSSINDLTESGSDGVYMPMYDSEVITKTNLKKPKVETFGKHDASYYPSYLNQITDFDSAKRAEIFAENQKIIEDAKTWFANGTLKDNLKKHVSADGQFYATTDFKKAPRIEKEITINTLSTPRKRSLGVFAPAGEILTITIDESMVGKVTVNIGYPYNAECEIGSSDSDRWYNVRMAKYFMEFPLTETVTYIGSPLGGMVTMNGVSSDLGNFKITVSGGVDMPDYKLGVSTKEDWQNILAAPGPYVWLLTPYQYFVMPKEAIKDIEDPYLALLWWHKASMISLYATARESLVTPIISVFDSYVYIGEGVAKVWAFVTNAPTYWCHGILDYDNLMQNGAWGAAHEFNHHFQTHGYDYAEWGVGYIDEITNNVLNAASYIMLTDIAETRSESNVLGVWGGVSDPYCNYAMLNNASKNQSTYEAFDTSKLFGYVDLMHTFGAEKFLDFIRAQYGVEKVEGYTGKYLTEDSSLKTQDTFALFASLYYQTDFVDYFTKVWHFELSDSVIEQIKSHNFDEYFSINNLYSAGVKGIETGRAYKVNVGQTTVFDFDKYTLCSTDSYKLESVSSPQHGKLTQNSDGTYSYVPDSDFIRDSFELVYKVTLNGKTYTRTLVVKLVANYNFVETVTYNGEEGNGKLTVQEAISQYEKESNVAAKGTASNFTSNTPNGYNLTHFKATVVFPFSQKITFMVFGDDKTLLTIGNQTAFTNTYIGDVNNAKKQETNKITVSVKAGEPLKIEAYCFNGGGGGKLQLKYSVDGGETYNDIPSSYCYAYNSSKKDIEAVSKTTSTNVYPAFVDFRNQYINRYYGDSIVFAPTEAKCLDNDGNEVKTVRDADIYAMFDGDTSTGFHTAWQGAITAYPHNYYLTFQDGVQFNNIKFVFQAGYYAIGEYEIYVSEDGVNYELLVEGNNTTQTNFNLPFETTVSTKYVKLVVKSNSSGQRFTNIKEIQFCQTLDLGEDYNVYSSADSVLHYDYAKKWKKVTGTYINNKALSAKNGKVKFYLTGTDLALYSINAESKITIDGVTYTIKANSNNHNPSFIIDGLENTIHSIEIEGKNMTIDMLKTTGRITRDDRLFVNWAGLGVSIAVGAGFIGYGTAFTVLVIKLKKKETSVA